MNEPPLPDADCWDSLLGLRHEQVAILLVSVVSVAAGLIRDDKERAIAGAIVLKMSNKVQLSTSDADIIKDRLRVPENVCVRISGREEYVQSCIADCVWGMLNLINDTPAADYRMTMGFVLASYDKLGRLLAENNCPELQGYLTCGTILGRLKNDNKI